MVKKNKNKSQSRKIRKSHKKNQPIDIHSLADLDKHLHSGKPVVLMIHASWCSACKSSMPAFNNAAGDNPDVQFVRIDGHIAREAADKISNTRIPNICVIQCTR